MVAPPPNSGRRQNYSSKQSQSSRQMSSLYLLSCLCIYNIQEIWLFISCQQTSATFGPTQQPESRNRVHPGRVSSNRKTKQTVIHEQLKKSRPKNCSCQHFLASSRSRRSHLRLLEQPLWFERGCLAASGTFWDDRFLHENLWSVARGAEPTFLKIKLKVNQLVSASATEKCFGFFQSKSKTSFKT